ncbi:MAG: FkbM family methyltransferase [Acidobacteriaceae bacterium]
MLKASVRKLARKCGYEILGPSRAYATQRSLAKLLQQEGINLVLDVGANSGQFGSELRASRYDGRIISFEPQSSAHAELKRRTANDPGWTVADRTAIGAQLGSVNIHISENSVSSSILSMLPAHSDAAPESHYVDMETVPVNTLDNLCSFGPADRVALKIDVQGYERQVLEGAPRVLDRCLVVIAEMSFVPLYDGQVLAREFWDVLAAEGFAVWSLEPGFRHPKTGRMLQVDGVSFRCKEGRNQEGAGRP